VSVKDPQGGLVNDLEPAEFRLLEDGVEQTITGFSAEPVPLAAAVLIDAAMRRPAAQRMRRTFPSLVEAFGEFDEVGVFSFDSKFRQAAGFTTEREAWRAALGRLEAGADYTQTGEPLASGAPRINGWPVGGAPPRTARPAPRNMDDAVLAAHRLVLSRGQDRRKIILLISDGSHAGAANPQLPANLRHSNVIVYSIGLDDARLSGGSTPLGRYGPPSGGELFAAAKESTLEHLWARITEQARYQYVLTYTPQRPSSVAPVFRSLEVRVRRPGLRVVARDGYLPEARSTRP